MSISPNLKTHLRLYILCALVACLWVFSSNANSTTIKPQSLQQIEGSLPVVTDQLKPNNGVIPVELRCEDAELSAPNALEKLSCVIKNNTRSYISAGALHTSITLEKDGKTLEVSTYDTFDTFLHPDFRAAHLNNLISPGKEYRLNDLPVSYSDDVVIKGIAVQIDYIEFADNSILGNNRSGSRIIGNVREGAVKYKDWLIQEYRRRGESIDALLPLLDGSHPLPELGLQNAEQERGAIMYRKYSLRT
jgi:hypothetical protein